MAGPSIASDVRALAPGFITLRRQLHRHPELAFEEVWTAGILAGQMRVLGLEVKEGIGGTGVLAMLDGAHPGKTLLIRADMDALPIADTTGTAYASKLENRNHACGHDVHAALVTGVAQVLVRHRDCIAGRVAFVFQPADEPMRGAKRMIEAGLLERTKAEMSLSVHVLPMAHTGQVVIQPGPLWASRDELTLRITGPSPSRVAARPFDFAPLAAHLTTSLYELVERESWFSGHVTFRVRSLHAEQAGPAWLGGPRGGPDQAAIELNLAVFDNPLRARLPTQIEELSRRFVGAAGGTLHNDTDYALPAVVNDHQVTGALQRAAEAVVGQSNILSGWRHPFSDDVGLLMAAVPGCLMLLGTANPAKGITESWHRPGFDIDEDALPLGVEIIARAALDLLP